MPDTLKWSIPNEAFEDGSKLEDWLRIESSPWHSQYDVMTRDEIYRAPKPATEQRAA